MSVLGVDAFFCKKAPVKEFGRIHDSPCLLDLGPCLSQILEELPLSDRLKVACASTGLRDYVYSHHELWPTLSAVGCAARPSSPEKPSSASSFERTLAWAGARRSVRRLRAAIVAPDRFSLWSGWLEASFAALPPAISALSGLVSLHISVDVGVDSCPTADAPFMRNLLEAAPASLKQLSLSVPSLHLPATAARLQALTALALHSRDGSGVTLASGALPAGLLRLEIGGMGAAELPAAIVGVAALQSLAIDWASDAPPIAPDLSLLESGEGTSHLTHLSLGYFQTDALPKALPSTLRSLELHWNLTTTEPAARKAGFNVNAFHSSFSCLEPLTALTHLNLNNALGGWGLPPAVMRLQQLQSLGVAGPDPSAWGARRANLAEQLLAFPRLRQLDIEIFDAAADWDHLARLTSLERLRLGKGERPEAYVRPEVQSVIGKGLVKLLPALPRLKEVYTEGMLLPATSLCGRWARLAGLEAPELREEAVKAVDCLHARGVLLGRWYTWPFLPYGGSRQEGLLAWDEVM